MQHIYKNFAEIREILDRLDGRDAPKYAKKTRYLVFLAWIFLWETIRLIRDARVPDMTKELWIQAVNHIEQELSIHARQHRPLSQPHLRLT